MPPLPTSIGGLVQQADLQGVSALKAQPGHDPHADIGAEFGTHGRPRIALDPRAYGKGGWASVGFNPVIPQDRVELLPHRALLFLEDFFEGGWGHIPPAQASVDARLGVRIRMPVKPAVHAGHLAALVQFAHQMDKSTVVDFFNQCGIRGTHIGAHLGAVE